VEVTMKKILLLLALIGAAAAAVAALRRDDLKSDVDHAAELAKRQAAAARDAALKAKDKVTGQAADVQDTIADAAGDAADAVAAQ
jgi:hypothetical protein